MNVIIECVTSVSMKVLWNEEEIETFTSSHNIRQVNSLSFCFIHEALAHFIKDCVNLGT